jgi:hypothetical protein
MQTYILKENVLTDNILLLAETNQVFKGGFIAIVKEYEFLNSWSDKQKPIKKFRSENRLNEFLTKNYPDFSY